jgi:hypothetical protein
MSNPTLLKALVVRHHWQVYRTFCVQFDNAASELADIQNDPQLRSLSISQSTFERWVRGDVHTRPRPDQCRVLEHLFKYPVDQLLAPETVPISTPTAGLVPALPAVRDFRTMAESAMWSPRHSDRETVFNPDFETIDIGKQVKMAASRARRFAELAEGSTIGPETLAQLHDDVRRLATAYPRLPLPTFFNDLVEVQDSAFRLLESGRQRPNQARDLYLLAGISSGMLAKASHDLGDPHAAMAQARTAFVCADNADHNGLRAWIRGLQSLITYWAGQPQDAVHFAQSGNSVRGEFGGTAAVWLHSLEARANAALGDDESASRAMSAAEDARDEVAENDLDSFGGILAFPRVRQLYYAADTAVRMASSTVNAEDQAQEAVTAYQQAEDDWAFGDQAGSHTALALARIQNNQLDGVQDALQIVLDLPVEQRVNGIVASVQQVHTALCTARWASTPAARVMRGEIEAFTQLPLRALPR